MSFGNDWTSLMIVHKAHVQKLLNEAQNERTAKTLKNEDEPRRRWQQPQLPINKEKTR